MEESFKKQSVSRETATLSCLEVRSRKAYMFRREQSSPRVNYRHSLFREERGPVLRRI